MARQLLIRTGTGIYHARARVNHRLNFPLPLEDCWRIFIYLLKKIKEMYGVEIHAFVMMSNHYHLLISTPLLNIDLAMRYLNREFTRKVSLKTGLENHIFGSRYSWGILDNRRDFSHVLKYVFRNPVKAGMVKNVEEYQFSTVSSLYEKRSFPFVEMPKRLEVPELTPRKPVLEWLNTPLPKEQAELIRKAVRRKTFQFSNRPCLQKAIKAIPKPPW